MRRRKFITASSSLALAAMFEAHNLLGSSIFTKSAERKEPLIQAIRLLTTSPIAELRNFYEKVIGLTILSASNTSLSFQAGKSTITFTKVESDIRPFYHFAFNIPENKIEKALVWQRDRTPIVHPNPDGPRDAVVNFRHWNAHSIFFLDPAGNLVEYIARHDLKNSASGEFSVNDILYASEIGFIVNDVAHTGNMLCESLHVKGYRPMEQNFWPIGDEYGLLLMIKKGRVWSSNPKQINSVDVFKTSVSVRNLPTNWKSGDYPYEILIE